jgi:hypothetical protein
MPKQSADIRTRAGLGCPSFSCATFGTELGRNVKDDVIDTNGTALPTELVPHRKLLRSQPGFYVREDDVRVSKVTFCQLPAVALYLLLMSMTSG